MASKAQKEQESFDDLIGCLLTLLAVVSLFIGAFFSYFTGIVFFSSVLLIVLVIYIFIRILENKEDERIRVRIRSSGIQEIDKMNGNEFEIYLAAMYHSFGYSVTKTKGSGDFGADLVLKKSGKKIAVQVKRYNKNVGVRAVQEVLSSLSYYGAQEGWVVTNSYFTPSAKELSQRGNIKLIDRNKLIKEIILFQETENVSKEKTAP